VITDATRTQRTSGTVPRHPLDPLTAPEIELVSGVLTSADLLGPTTLVVSMGLLEPPKAVVRSWQPGDAIERSAVVALIDRSTGALTETAVSVTEEKILSSAVRPGVQAPFVVEELANIREVVCADHRFVEGLKLRGITDTSSVYVEPIGIGTRAATTNEKRRLAWCLSWVRDENYLAHPIQGLIAIIDCSTPTVLSVEDHGVVPVPPESGAYESVEPYREDLNELEITQPNGPSFEIDGWQVRWQKWQFRIGISPREGLVLHDLRYADGDETRSVLHRASYTELFVPYGDVTPSGYPKNAFDQGENGLARMMNSLELGCDCLGEIRYFDVDLCDGFGKPYQAKNVVCLHEEDFGLLWKHYDEQERKAAVRRSRRLTVSMIVTYGNYDYAFYWHLYLDGTIESEVKLTGLVQTTADQPDASPETGTMIAPGLVAPYHQHWFTARLDPAVDGIDNTVIEVEAEPIPRGDSNPHGNAWRTKETVLQTEQDGVRRVDTAVGRFWRIVNVSKPNGRGSNVSYRLVPGANTRPLADAESDAMLRAGYLDRHVWVTPFSAEEAFPCGEYPNQNPGGDGLPRWASADRPIENTDIVLWYSFGSNHVPRLEDWPIMSVERLGFALKPDGFFDRNASLDVPPPDRCHAHG
jgi:primary-amine oxidase